MYFSKSFCFWSPLIFGVFFGFRIIVFNLKIFLIAAFLFFLLFLIKNYFPKWRKPRSLLSVFQLKILLIVLIAFFIGFFRADLYYRKNLSTDRVTEEQIGPTSLLSGNILSVAPGNFQSQEIILENLELRLVNKLVPLSGKAILNTKAKNGIFCGDQILFDGRFLRIERESYKNYLESQKIYYLIQGNVLGVLNQSKKKGLGCQFREMNSQIEAQIQKIFPEPSATLMSGILIGKNPESGSEYWNDLKRTGLSHIAVVSGSNISILVLFMISGASVIGRRRIICITRG